MGSRYLLIEFDNEAQADALRAQIDNATRKGKRFRVVGLFAKPTGYCQCDKRDQITTRTWDSTTKRGKKYGWWVCTMCKRPTSQLSGLVNLIKPRDIINPPKWLRRGWFSKKLDSEAMHYIGALSGSVFTTKVLTEDLTWLQSEQAV